MRGGIPGVTISSDAARARAEGKTWGCWLCKFLDALNTDHCNQAWSNDIVRAQQVEQYLKRNPEATVAEAVAAVPIKPLDPPEHA